MRSFLRKKPGDEDAKLTHKLGLFSDRPRRKSVNSWRLIHCLRVCIEMNWCAFLFLLVHIAHSKKLPNIYWNSTNPIFDISNTDHVIPVDIDDRLSIFCPKPSVFYEYSSIYMVSEEEYTHCVLLNPHLIGLCGNSSSEVSFGIVFRRHSPIPGGLQFVPGQNYYMITTSDGSREGMDRKKGGLCLERQMKIKFEVADRKTTNPRFAASIQKKDEEKSSTPVMYIIHGEDSTDDGLDDDGVTATGVPLVILTSMLMYYLL